MANIWAGFSDRGLGQNTCKAVIDGGKAQSFMVYFKRAKKYFTNALKIAKNMNNKKIKNIALGGLASVEAALGKWVTAAKEAKKVPIDFKFQAIFSTNSSREENGWYDVSIQTGQYTVYGTKWAGLDDPRLPQKVIFTANGDTSSTSGGTTLYIQQRKYPLQSSNITITKGTEMILIRAEMQLRVNKDISAAMNLINKERKYYGLGNLKANNLKEAWDILENERGKVLWLEGRRFWDLRRWFKDQGPAHNGYLKGKAKCAPIGQQELDTNPNL